MFNITTYNYENIIKTHNVNNDLVLIYKVDNDIINDNNTIPTIHIDECIVKLNYNARYFNVYLFNNLIIDTILNKCNHTKLIYKIDKELLNFADSLLSIMYKNCKYTAKIFLNAKTYYKLLKNHHIYNKSNKSYLKNLEIIINNYISEYNAIIITDDANINLYVNKYNDFTLDFNDSNFFVVDFNINTLTENRINKLKKLKNF